MIIVVASIFISLCFKHPQNSKESPHNWIKNMLEN